MIKRDIAKDRVHLKGHQLRCHGLNAARLKRTFQSELLKDLGSYKSKSRHNDLMNTWRLYKFDRKIFSLLFRPWLRFTKITKRILMREPYGSTLPFALGFTSYLHHLPRKTSKYMTFPLSFLTISPSWPPQEPLHQRIHQPSFFRRKSKPQESQEPQPFNVPQNTKFLHRGDAKPSTNAPGDLSNWPSGSPTQLAGKNPSVHYWWWKKSQTTT